MQLRQPRLAEMVADVLRGRILSGEMADGSMLSKQEELIDEFSVSKPSIREALRILETEGLITVLRGNIGGAIVHVPQTSGAAYMLGLVLQSKKVNLRDVGEALKSIEPICASLCAERADRATAVLPKLRALQEASIECIESDVLRFTNLARQFHETIVASCGNQTMIQLVGALEAVWTAHEEQWAKEISDDGEFPKIVVRRNSLKAHEKIMTMIEEGKGDVLGSFVRKHLEGAIFYGTKAGDRTVNADVLR